MLEGAGLSEKIQVDSAGTHSFQVGAPPDPRSQATALRRGVDLHHLRARRVTVEDFAEFDYLLAMDQDNFDHLIAACPDSGLKKRIQLFLNFAPHLPEREVPDPYYGGPGGFDRVMDLIEAAAEGLLVHIREQHRL